MVIVVKYYGFWLVDEGVIFFLKLLMEVLFLKMVINVLGMYFMKFGDYYIGLWVNDIIDFFF